VVNYLPRARAHDPAAVWSAGSACIRTAESGS